MTFTEFVTSVCIEVIREESSIPKQSSSSFITESKLKAMIEDGSVNTLSDSQKFTPLAYDLYKSYVNRKK